MVRNLPTSLGGGVDIFRAVIDVEEIGPPQTSGFLDQFVNARRRLHHAMLVRKHITIKLVEERKTFANETNAEVVCVGKNVTGDFFGAKLFVPAKNHWSFRKNVAEEF